MALFLGSDVVEWVIEFGMAIKAMHVSFVVPMDVEAVPVSANLLLFTLIVLTIVRFLHLYSRPECPQANLCQTEKNKMKRIIDGMPIMKEEYVPPWLWGRSGHIQTGIYGVLGHSSLKRTADSRRTVKLSDGTTVVYDVFEPIAKHESGKEVTLCLTPGIANTSESNYIRTCVHYAQEAGFRCVVLNHVGALVGVTLTSPRIFSYGGTQELHAVVKDVIIQYPQTKIISLGFSMGANITTKFLVEVEESIRERIIFGISVGQGYCATSSAPLYHDWENSRRAYNYVITENMKRLLRRNYEMAVRPLAEQGIIDEEKLWTATSIISLDEAYTRRVNGFKTLHDFYAWCSCLPLLDDLKVPIVFLNSRDDPIFPHSLWNPVKKLSSLREDMCMITTKHGGHLGFLEGPSLAPHSVTWLDRFIVQICNSSIEIYDKDR